MNLVQRYFMYISYLGTGFRGSQFQHCRSQRNILNTVQGTLEKTLTQRLALPAERIRIVSSSRTDSGVHALKAGFQIDLPPIKGRFISPQTLQTILNSAFKSNGINIRISDSIWVPDIFNVIHSSIEKVYMYRVAIGKPGANINSCLVPISEVDRTFFINNHRNKFCPDKVHKVTDLFVGKKDFSTFAAHFSKNKKWPVCNISSFKFESSQALMPGHDSVSNLFDYYQFMCTGDRFLYKMVRRMVGAVLSFAFGNISYEQFEIMFNNPGPCSWSTKCFVAPAHGLYLVNVHYKPEHLIVTDEEVQEKIDRVNEKMEDNNISTVPNYSGLLKFYEKIDKI